MSLKNNYKLGWFTYTHISNTITRVFLRNREIALMSHELQQNLLYNKNSWNHKYALNCKKYLFQMKKVIFIFILQLWGLNVFFTLNSLFKLNSLFILNYIGLSEI